MVNRHQQDLFQAKEEDGLGARPSSGVTMEHQPSRTKKKVEWRNNLNAGETVAPEDRSPNWDSETGTYSCLQRVEVATTFLELNQSSLFVFPQVIYYLTFSTTIVASSRSSS